MKTGDSTECGTRRPQGLWNSVEKYRVPRSLSVPRMSLNTSIAERYSLHSEIWHVQSDDRSIIMHFSL